MIYPQLSAYLLASCLRSLAALAALCCLLALPGGTAWGGDGPIPPGEVERSPLFRAPEIDDLGSLQFYQLDTLSIWLDTLVTDDPGTIEDLRWEVEVLDPRFLDNPNTESDHHLVVNLDPESRILTFTTTRLFFASDIPVRLRVVDPEGLSDEEVFRLNVLSVEGVPGKVYTLKQSYPNPFHDRAAIEYWIPIRARVRISVYDMLGRLVARLVDRHGHPSGVHTVYWQPKNAASGVYIYRLEAVGVDGSLYQQTHELTFIR